jgi:hypothetical protein
VFGLGGVAKATEQKQYQLAKMGLDWESARYPPAGPRNIQPPLALSVELGARSPDEAAKALVK